MECDPSRFGPVRFATGTLPQRDRVPFWREVFGRQIANIDIELQAEGPLEADATLLALPGVRLGWCRSSSPAHWRRTAASLKDGDDDFALLLPLQGRMLRTQWEHELKANSGEAVGLFQSELASVRFLGPNHHIGLMVPRQTLHCLVKDLDRAARLVVPRYSPALRLLKSYLGTVRANANMFDQGISRLVAIHVSDLVAAALGAARDAQEIVARSIRAARIETIKADFAANPGLGLHAIAARQGVSARYVQKLFEAGGTTFTAFALEARLAHARNMLTDPRYAAWTIAAIAYEAGFGDLSHFNRSFRRRYGAPPSEVRAEAARKRLD